MIPFCANSLGLFAVIFVGLAYTTVNFPIRINPFALICAIYNNMKQITCNQSQSIPERESTSHFI